MSGPISISTRPTLAAPPTRPAAALRILGIDPGSVVTGFSVIEERAGRLQLIRAGVARPAAGLSFSARLDSIFRDLEQVIADTAPAEVAVEGLFHAKHARSALLLGHARGVALLAAARSALDVFEYAPQEVKKATVGEGRADKMQVRTMVQRLLGLAQELRPLDASDATAVAICHAHSRRMRSLAVPTRSGRRATPPSFEVR